MSVGYASAPEWFRKGVECAVKAPSARNKQPVIFEYTADGVKTTVNGTFSCNKIDLGIAEYHFELGSGRKITEFE
jgi:hypothetical protein